MRYDEDEDMFVYFLVISLMAYMFLILIALI